MTMYHNNNISQISQSVAGFAASYGVSEGI